MKIALAQQNYHIGNFEKNTEKIIDAIQQAKKQKADLIVFSELCICGYPPATFWSLMILLTSLMLLLMS
jgi:NAD+ synthase (glutamine-hydrolysing)